MVKTFGKGIIFASLSFILWGIFPLYWKFLITVDSLHILAFRILLSLVLVGTILLANKNTAWLAVFREPKKVAVLLPTALLICCNWGLYIWAVNREHTIDASLGYYINPLISILLGRVFFKERLKPLQWVAAAIALAGVLIVTLASRSLPWVSLSLALSFGFYGLLKKKLELSALESLGAETLASAPIGIFLLFFSFKSAAFSGWQGLGYLTALPPQTCLLLALAGLVTTLPLYCFAHGAKLLPLSTLGFTQFINPTLQFALGLFVFKEAFPTHHFVAFIFIWTAVVVYILSLRFAAKKQ